MVAALHGHVLGGGLELAMACHWRVAEPATWLGLPEVTLGLIPGSLGTQRLPRLVGLARAAHMVASGERVPAATAHAWGLVDGLSAPGAAARQAGVDHARQLLARGAGARPTCDLAVDCSGLAPDHFARERQRAYADRARFPSGLLLVDALEAATGPFAWGERVEAQAFELARRSAESHALRHLFFAQRKLAKRTQMANMVSAENGTSAGTLAGPLTDLRGEPLLLTRRAFDDALAQSLATGIAPQRLARALRGFGWTISLPVLAVAGCGAPQEEAPPLDEPELLWPLLDAVVDAAARLLEQGRMARASDLDVGWTRDHGFPAFRGGPLYNADASGLPRVVQRLGQAGRTPCALLCSLAQSGGRLSAQAADGPAHAPISA